MRNKKVVELTPYELAVKEFHIAAAAYRHAEANFHNAFPEYFEIANQELTAARTRVDSAMQRVRILHQEAR